MNNAQLLDVAGRPPVALCTDMLTWIAVEAMQGFLAAGHFAHPGAFLPHTDRMLDKQDQIVLASFAVARLMLAERQRQLINEDPSLRENKTEAPQPVGSAVG